MLEAVIKKWGGCEVTAMDVYIDMFHLGQGYIQKKNNRLDSLKQIRWILEE
jgi:hypothetical protein